jgi:hypothetical protein
MSGPQAHAILQHQSDSTIRFQSVLYNAPVMLSTSRSNMSHTHFAEIFRYMLDGVKNSADIEENTGTRFGGLGELTAAANTSRIVSSDG